MKFAIVELKYVLKKFFIVRADWIKDFKGKYSSVVAVLCFISTDLSDEPNFVANYSETYNGATGLYKVFIRKITEEAIAFQKGQLTKRIQSVPQKYRVPTNTDSELNAEEKKQKRNEKRIQKLSQENAAMKNSSHLAELVKSQKIESMIETSDSDSIEKESLENQTSLGDTIQGDPSPSLTAKKTSVGATAMSFQIKANTTGNSKVFSRLSSNQTTMPIPPNVVAVGKENKKPAASTVRNKKEQNRLNVFDQKQRDEINQPFSTTATKPNKSNLSFDSKNTILPSSSSVGYKKLLNQTNVLNPKKGQNLLPVSTTTKKPVSTKVVLEATATLSSSSPKVLNQVILLHPNKQDQISLPVATTTKKCINAKVALEAPAASSSFVIKNTQNQNSGVNPLHEGQNQLVNKIFRNETVAPVAARKSPTTSFTDKKTYKRFTNTTEEIAAKKQKVVAVGQRSNPNDAVFSEQSPIIKALKKENAHLKMNIEILTEKNDALQKALVICTKSIPEPLNFVAQDEGRLYDCGVFFNKDQCKILDATTEHRRFCNYLTQAVFGVDVLKQSSVTGTVSNRTKGPAKTALDPIKLKFIYDMMAIRTKNSILFTQTKINILIAKKIANLVAGDQPLQPKCKSIKKGTKLKEVDEEDNDVTDEDETEIADEELFEEDNEVEINGDKSLEINEDEMEIDQNEKERYEEEGEQYLVDEVIEEGNLESYEQGNGLGDADAIYQSDMASTGNARLVNDGDYSYYVLDMPDLQLYDFSLNDL